MTQQRAAGSGGSAAILAEDGLRIAEGGSVRLTATPGYSYQWSNGATARTIEVSTPGNYSVTVTSPCGSLVSGSVTVSEHATPAPPTVQGDLVMEGETATLSAVGNNLVWYDAPVDGEVVGTGVTLETAPLDESVSYWVGTQTTMGGENNFTAKTNATGAINSNISRQHLIFDAYEPFELASVKVYATGNGDRHFVLVDNVGNLIEERYIYVRDGEQRVQLDFKVPVGTAHKITAFDDNTEIVLNLHRDNAGVSYPYQLGTVGAITGSTGGSAFYYYLYDWEVRTPELVLTSERVEVVAEVSYGVELDAFLFLEGAYDQVSGLMRDDLRGLGLLPVAEPYAALGYTFVMGGSGTAAEGMFAVSGNDAVVDWVFVELRDANVPSTVIATSVGLVRRSGQVVSASGEALSFRVLPGQYHVAFKHRNHMGIMTAAPLQLIAEPVQLDMTLSSTPTWGTNARKQVGAKMVMWTGNVLNDDRLKYTGAGNDRDPILAAIGGTVPTATTQGYLSEDNNLDGVVRYTGSNNDRDPILANIGGIVPTDVRVQQLP